MKKLIIPPVAVFLSYGGAAVAQTATVTVAAEVRTFVQEQKHDRSPLKAILQSARRFRKLSKSTRSPISPNMVM